ncbi:MAG: hypothetical protein XD74_0500 [Actinobacteria bacterium 66_15]|nr:MAG: hypothetical protein XD74_0500 [Actinobacteria bacterium 66_15]
MKPLKRPDLNAELLSVTSDSGTDLADIGIHAVVDECLPQCRSRVLCGEDSKRGLPVTSVPARCRSARPVL